MARIGNCHASGLKRHIVLLLRRWSRIDLNGFIVTKIVVGFEAWRRFLESPWFIFKVLLILTFRVLQDFGYFGSFLLVFFWVSLAMALVLWLVCFHRSLDGLSPFFTFWFCFVWVLLLLF